MLGQLFTAFSSPNKVRNYTCRSAMQVCSSSSSRTPGLTAAGQAKRASRRRLQLPAARKQVLLQPPRCRASGGAAGSWDAPPPLRPPNQTLELAFDVIDVERTGLLDKAQCVRLVAYFMALQSHKAPDAAVRPLTWDQHLLASAQSARQLGGGPATRVAMLGGFLRAKLTGGLQKHPPRASDLLWSAAGMGAAMLVLGLLAGAVRSWPIVGPLHQQGLPLLLGSFGTLCILLFGKPEAEPVRLYALVTGQLGAAAIAVATLRLCGPSLWARAAAMAATVAFMQATDCVHPPGGALVLLAMDNAAVQTAGLAYLLWPSLLLSLAVLLPISAATNWLRRNAAFDVAPGGRLVLAATRLTRERDWRREQALRAQAGALETLTGDEEPPLAARLVEGLRGMLSGLGALLSWHMQQREVEQLVGRPAPRARMPRDDSAVWSASSSSIEAAGAGAAAAAAALQAAVRRRLRREELERERRLEDRGHRARVWGSADVLPAVEALEERIMKRLEQEQSKQKQQRQQQPGVQRREWMYRWQAGSGTARPQQDGDDGKQDGAGSGSAGAAR